MTNSLQMPCKRDAIRLVLMGVALFVAGCHGLCADLSQFGYDDGSLDAGQLSDADSGQNGADCSTDGDCPDGQECIDDTCFVSDPDCPTGQRLCNDICIDITSHDAHCGNCGQSCPEAQHCEGGECVCGSDYEACNGACVDTSADVDHCGGCGESCSSGDGGTIASCIDGECHYECDDAIPCDTGCCSFETELASTASGDGDSVSLTLDSEGNPHLAYTRRDGSNSENRSLRYTRFDGADWQTEVLQSGQHFTTDIWLDTADLPRILYGGRGDNDVGFAEYDGNQWHFEQLDDNIYLRTFSAPTADLGPDNAVHGVYTSSSGVTGRPVMHLRRSGDDWISSPITDEEYRAVGPDIAVDSEGNPHVAYRDNDENFLHYARYDDGDWQVEIVDDDTGVYYYVSLDLDSQDHPHITYTPFPGDGLHYAWYDGDEWTTESVVDFDVEKNRIAIDSQDRPHVVFEEHEGAVFATKHLHYAIRDEGEWTIHTFEEDLSMGNVYLSFLLDEDDRPHIAYRRVSDGLVYTTLE